MYHKAILVTDLSPASDAVIQCLATSASLGIREILLTYPLGAPQFEPARSELAKLVAPQLESQRAAIESLGFSVSLSLPSKSLAEEISTISTTFGADLVIAGSQGHSPGIHALFGNEAITLLRHGSLPVLVLRQREADKPCEIAAHLLHPTDFSDNAELAFAHVKRLVEAGARRVTLLHVQDKVRVQNHSAERIEEFNRIDTGRLEHRRDDLLKIAPVDVDITIRHGHAAEEILKAAAEGGSLIVMGCQGKGFFREVFLGGVSQKTMSHASCHVMVVPSPR